ncbi:MAG: LysE family translocator [Methylobacteriaceae bacterium]|nr:LysE family translocator [Methylobacteriaceae bacterium]
MHFTFWATAFLIVATPGTGAIYTLAAGLSQGPRAGVWAAFASTLGIVPHIAAALTGLAALLHASALAFDMLKWLGVAYLLWMAWGMFNDTGALRVTADAPKKTPLRVLADGMALNLLNPKLSIFFVAFLPQFVRADAISLLIDMVVISLAFMALTFVVFAVYGAAAGALRTHMIARPGVLVWLRRSFAAGFGLLAAKLATSER